MSFASYKSPFDEALSKPLINVENESGDTDQVSKNPKKGSKGNNVLTSKSDTVPLSSPAVYSKKLTVQPSVNRETVKPSSSQSFSNFNIDQKEIIDSQEYQPPNLSLETTTEKSFSQQSSLEEALLRERNAESRSILQKMTTISAITSELNSLVQNQQGTIDEVEDHAYGVHDSAERGVAELETANNMMRKNNGSGVEVFWKYFFGVIGVGGLIIAIIIFLHSL